MPHPSMRGKAVEARRGDRHAGLMPDLVVSTLAERPELTSAMFDMPDTWPRFMLQDEVANAYFWQVPSSFPQHCVVATEGGEIVARGFSAPFRLHGGERGGLLPSGGWDRVLVWAF